MSRSTVDQRVRLRMLETGIGYTVPAAIAHGVVIAVLAGFAVRAGELRIALAFLLCEVLLHAAVVTFHRRWRGASFEDLARGEGRARRTLRALGAALGVAVGWAGATWTHAEDPLLALATVVALASSAAGATMASGPDPITCRLMLAGIFVPTTVAAARLHPVETLIWIAYGTGCLVTNGYIHRLLHEWTSLRAEKDVLLEAAERERAATARARDEALKNAATLQRFLAAASHDLRQPAQALSLFVDLLENADDHDRALMLRGSLRQSVEMLRVTLDALFEISSLDLDKVPVRPVATTLSDVAAHVWAGTRELCLEHDVTLTIAGASPHVHVFVDPSLLTRVLHNLASNAIRHSGSDRVLVAFRRRDAAVIAQVWDRGVGIADADQARIFDEFVQLGNRERRRDRGLGLGLAIVRRICERCGWTMRLDSVEGRGTRVSVTAPIAAPPERTISGRAPWNGPRPRRVLLVEDDPMVLAATRAWLVAAGLDTLTAASTDEASAHMLAHPDLDVLVTDVRLPGATPLRDLLSLARTRRPQALPVIAVTGDLSLPDELEHDGVCVLRKPVSSADLASALRRVCEAHLRGGASPRSTP